MLQGHFHETSNPVELISILLNQNQEIKNYSFLKDFKNMEKNFKISLLKQNQAIVMLLHRNSQISWFASKVT
jgi:hypothetical protein